MCVCVLCVCPACVCMFVFVYVSVRDCVCPSDSVRECRVCVCVLCVSDVVCMCLSLFMFVCVMLLVLVCVRVFARLCGCDDTWRRYCIAAALWVYSYMPPSTNAPRVPPATCARIVTSSATPHCPPAPSTAPPPLPRRPLQRPHEPCISVRHAHAPPTPLITFPLSIPTSHQRTVSTVTAQARLL